MFFKVLKALLIDFSVPLGAAEHWYIITAQNHLANVLADNSLISPVSLVITLLLSLSWSVWSAAKCSSACHILAAVLLLQWKCHKNLELQDVNSKSRMVINLFKQPLSHTYSNFIYCKYKNVFFFFFRDSDPISGLNTKFRFEKCYSIQCEKPLLELTVLLQNYCEQVLWCKTKQGSPLTPETHSDTEHAKSAALRG